MTHRPRRATAAIALVGALALVGCSGDGEGSPATVTVTADAPGNAADGSAETGTGDADAGDEATEEVIEPAEQQTIEIGEEKAYSSESGAYTLTVHRAVVNDFYVEVEITIVNDSDQEIGIWYGARHSSPRLFDDRGRVYAFQIQAGGDNEMLHLASGEGLDAVLVFAGRVDSKARELTLDFTELPDYRNVEWPQMTFDIPLAGA